MRYSIQISLSLKTISVASSWAIHHDFVVFAAQNSPNEFSTEWGREIECKPDRSPQGVIAVRAGSVVIAAAIGASAATKNVVQRAGRASDSGSDRGASANIGMCRSTDAGTRCSANRRAGQSSTAGDCKR